MKNMDEDTIKAFESLGYTHEQSVELSELAKLPVTIADISIKEVSDNITRMMKKLMNKYIKQ